MLDEEDEIEADRPDEDVAQEGEERHRHPEVDEQVRTTVMELFAQNPERVFYQRQITVLLEKRFFHWITIRVLKELEEEGRIKSELMPLTEKVPIRVYRPNGYRYWKRQAAELVKLVGEFSTQNFMRAVGLQGEVMFDVAAPRVNGGSLGHVFMSNARWMGHQPRFKGGILPRPEEQGVASRSAGTALVKVVLHDPRMAKVRRKRLPESSVCKPCWELHYCPYGPLVEFFPLLGYDGEPLSDIRSVRNRAIKALMSGQLKTEDEVANLVQMYLYSDPENWDYVQQYEAKEMACKIWGHVCPVFFAQSGATETKEGRTQSRSIPREVMLKVVRRDNRICQECYEYVADPEIEFDHVIPLARGGATRTENLRLLCRSCTRSKSDNIDGLLID